MDEQSKKVIEINQNIDTPLSSIENEVFSIKYLSYRSLEGQNSNQPNQDYLAIKADHSKLAFAICDGVGSSFVGNIASKFLGDYLINYFWDFDHDLREYWVVSESNIKKKIIKSMRLWSDTAQTTVRKYMFPDNISDLHKAGLEALRDEHGSETVFIAGLINFEDEKYSILTIGAGDIEYKLFDKDYELIFSNEQIKSVNNRWSTRWGVKGDIQVQRIPPNNEVSRLLFFTDGIIKENIISLSSNNIDTVIKDSLKKINDDISVVEIDLKKRGKSSFYKNLAMSDLNLHENRKLPEFEEKDYPQLNKKKQSQFIDLTPPEILKTEIKYNLFEAYIKVTLNVSKPRTYEFYISPTIDFDSDAKKFTVINGGNKIDLVYDGKFSLKGDHYIRCRTINNNNFGELSKVYQWNVGLLNLEPTIISYESNGSANFIWRQFIEAKYYQFKGSGLFNNVEKIDYPPPCNTDDYAGKVQAILYDGTKTAWENIAYPTIEILSSNTENIFDELINSEKKLGIKYPIKIKIGYFDKKKWNEEIFGEVYDSDTLRFNRSNPSIKSGIFELVNKSSEKKIKLICSDRFNRKFFLDFILP
ncbi:MAG: protein phosphatase 2C domain-containing protein [Anaerolineales bacterium]|nr:protein phosphatase 2C domain-containing protein [Anaerolineales bacterium]